MPLLSYFGTVGAVLLALLLLANFLLEPRRDGSAPASSFSEKNLPKPRIASRVARTTVGESRPLPSAEARFEPPRAVPVSEPGEPAEQMAWNEVQRAPTGRSSADDRQRKSFKRAKTTAELSRRHRKKPTYASPVYSTSAYYSYARAIPRLRYSAEGTLGAH